MTLSDIFQIAATGLLDGRDRLEAISQNAASASLPGYRRRVATERSFEAVLGATAADSSPQQATGTWAVDLRRGELKSTGRTLDLAIETDNMYFALTDGAQSWLTRAGSFRLGEEGVLSGERGLRVVGTQGDVRLPSSDVEVTPDGRVIHQGAIAASLQLFRPNDRLLGASGALLTAPDGIQPVEAGVGRVRSGMLEASNTDAAREMLGVMALSRQFESLVRALQGYDQSLGRAIQMIGES